MSVRYERKEHVVTTITQDDDGHVTRSSNTHKTINAAKRESRGLQIKAQKDIGRGVLRTIK